jgi:hypothetical protein
MDSSVFMTSIQIYFLKSFDSTIAMLKKYSSFNKSRLKSYFARFDRYDRRRRAAIRRRRAGVHDIFLSLEQCGRRRGRDRDRPDIPARWRRHSGGILALHQHEP